MPNIIKVPGGGGVAEPTIVKQTTIKEGWSTKAVVPVSRWGAGTGVANGKLHYMCGATSSSSSGTKGEHYCYNPADNTWTSKTSIGKKRNFVTLTVNDKIYTLGGYNAGMILSAHTCYDPALDSYSSKTSVPASRMDATGSVVNNKLYYIGGDDAMNYYNTNYCYTPSSDSWATKAVFPSSMSYVGACTIDNKIHTFGGGTNSKASGVQTHHYCYNPSSNSWSTLTALPAKRRDVGVGAVGHKAYIIGGSTGGGVVSTVYCYDNSTSSYITSNAPEAKYAHVGVISPNIYWPGGNMYSTYTDTCYALSLPATVYELEYEFKNNTYPMTVTEVD